MSLIYAFSAKQEKIWADWEAKQPVVIQGLAAKFKPNRLYRLKSTLQSVAPSGYLKNGLMQVDVFCCFNPQIASSFNIIDIEPDDLEEIQPVDGPPMMTFDEYVKRICIENKLPVEEQNG